MVAHGHNVGPLPFFLQAAGDLADDQTVIGRLHGEESALCLDDQAGDRGGVHKLILPVTGFDGHRWEELNADDTGDTEFHG